MNDPESLGENLEEIHQSLPPQDVEEDVINQGLVPLEGDIDFLLNYDEEDEPRLRATGELELPSPKDCLDAYQAVLLYNFLCSQANAPQLVFKPSSETPPQLYDWFVSSLSVCPLGDLLDQFIKKLVAWKKYTATTDEEVDEEELEDLGIRDSIEWTEFPGLRA